jgi:hypothetical protein
MELRQMRIGSLTTDRTADKALYEQKAGENNPCPVAVLAFLSAAILP